MFCIRFGCAKRVVWQTKHTSRIRPKPVWRRRKQWLDAHFRRGRSLGKYISASRSIVAPRWSGTSAGAAAKNDAGVPHDNAVGEAFLNRLWAAPAAKL